MVPSMGLQTKKLVFSRRAAGVPNHEHVRRALQAARSPMTAYEILTALRDTSINAPNTVYRALSRLL